MTLSEQETIINHNRALDVVEFYTSNRHHMRAISKDDRFTIVKEHFEDGERVAIDATVPADRWNVLGGHKRRVNYTPEQKEAMRERMALARANQ